MMSRGMQKTGGCMEHEQISRAALFGKFKTQGDCCILSEGDTPRIAMQQGVFDSC